MVLPLAPTLGQVAVSAALCTGVFAGTWLLGRWRYGRLLAEARGRLARSEERLASSSLENTRLKSQVDGLRAELREQQKLAATSVAQARTSFEKEAWGQVQAMNGLFIEPRRLPRKVTDFEDTQIL